MEIKKWLEVSIINYENGKTSSKVKNSEEVAVIRECQQIVRSKNLTFYG